MEGCLKLGLQIYFWKNQFLGKDWVEGIQESRASLLDYEEERKKRVAMLKEKEVSFYQTNCSEMIID